jgi:UTP--glucose-1-phosphate uridylyltransferase
MQIRKAVIPAAGLGTRFLPITKSLPKELLPILDKPMLHFAVEEAAQAGIEEVIIVTSLGKEAIANYFRSDPVLEQHLVDDGALELLEKVRHTSSMAQISIIIQEQPLGLGHAVLTAQDAVGSEPFVVILPDDIVAHMPGVTAQMLEVARRFESSVVAVERKPLEVVHNYGVIKASLIEKRVYRIESLVEKPIMEEAPSDLTVMGRYVLMPEIFDCLSRTPPGAKGEIQLTDGLSILLKSQEIYAYQFEGRRYDGGTPLGLLRASLEFALARPDTREEVISLLSDISHM